MSPSAGEASTSTSSMSTVPPPARRIPRPPRETESKRRELHRPSTLNLTDHAESSTSATAMLGTSLPTGNSLRMRGRKDNWQALRDMVSEDEEEQDSVSDTDTIRAPARRAPSTRSLRSLFTPRSSSRPAQSRPWSIAGTREEEGPMASAVLSSSPPQMNGYLEDGIEARLEGAGPAQAAKHHSNGPAPTPVTEEVNEGTPLLQARSEVVEKQSAPQSANALRALWPPSPTVVAVLKCAIAYLIASLFTFVPALSALLSTQTETDAHGRVSARPAYSAHMVATIVVYFNPAKTLGNMALALRFCFFLALGSIGVSLLSMGTIELFDYFSPSRGSKWDIISEMGDWVVCVLYIGGSMGTLAWLKIWVANPSFGSGCSMSAMILYTVVVKEGALPKLREIVLIVIIGCCIAALVCVLLFPSSATTRLQGSISKSLESFSTLLDLLTSTFLLERMAIKQNRTSLKDAVQNHSSAFKKLKTDLAEAKHERVFDGRIRGAKLKLYDAAIGSLGRLAQHLNGLRSSTRLQEEIIRAAREGRLGASTTGHKSVAQSLSAVELASIENSQDAEQAEMMAAVQLLTRFRGFCGAQMDDLNTRCDEVLDAIRRLAFGSNAAVDIPHLREQLDRSLRDFNASATRAIKRLYGGPRRERVVHPEDDDQGQLDDDSDDSDRELDEPGQADGPNETVFLVYFFLFTLEEFGREALFLLDTVEEIITAQEVSTWGYVKQLVTFRSRDKAPRQRYLYTRLQQLVPIDPSKLQPSVFPRNKEVHVSTASGRTAWSKLQSGFWAFGERLAQPDMRYAIKVGVAGAMLAAPAYTERGRPIFLEYRGEWALIAFFATMSQTVGQTNFLSFFRITGTLAGAGMAALFYTLFPDNPIALPILGWLFSLPCFYVITQMPEYGQASRFMLLAYNLTCLYAYNTRERDIEVTTIALQRSTTVIVGTLWSAIVSRYWWPFTARRELRMGISDFCVDLSYLYSKLVTTYSKGMDSVSSSTYPSDSDDEDEEAALLPESAQRHLHLTPGVRQFMAMELHLQSQLGTLNDLLKHTKNEPRLKGPFAYTFYKEILLSCERMLDRLHSMRCVTTRTEWDQAMRDTYVVPVNKEGREMAGNVILYFYTISSGFRLRTPMPPYLPPAEQARQRLVSAIRTLGPVKHRSVRGADKPLLFFAYALAMQEVISELDYLGGMMQEAFGVISQSSADDFELLFPLPAPEPHARVTRLA